ncbi:hypothetical protein BCR41DRAFT_94567 [Lobosporangium transversale]|uniref:Pre-rRNA-processing protein n=1 Tax=Lobosporangium transversale TaxID=64571 RepID=A0A1Y2GLT4_9FUNG|nr:hypothetical protein BCR41DRAFT_94567 [Lobosporangium transversale]ORZ13381.1 hypothetical protein BCR41DRAFT_94567 [Lobosporangium transversale]|eukprot:XP_021880462.1 hypothetical protein BCR41DRAFT_94567 [Lobosporangium transversale]
MPKSSNKKKKQKDADFKKTKLKVGKKKAVADNFTDTSFKAKAISLPSQSITHDKTTLLTNSRNATFAELITQLKHYSPGNRKDAILGLRDLFDHHPHLLSLHLGVLVNAIVRLLIDDSSIVRKTLQNFLSEFIPMLHPRDVHPFLPLLVVYTCSAMTHILEDIREDALKFMDLWVAAGGQIVVDGFWDKIIPNYVSLLTSDSNATNVSKLSSTMSFNTSLTNATLGGLGSSLSASRLVSRASTGKNAPGSLKAKCDVLQSLVGFLQEGLGGEGCEKDPYWFLRNFLGTPYARKSFNAIRTQWDRHDSLRDSRGIKRRKLQEQNVSERSSARSMYKGTVGSASDNIGDGSEASSQEGEMGTDNESIDSDQSTHSERNVQDEYLMFNSSPFISFSRAQTHHGILSTFPIHPITSCSPMTRTIFGGIKDPISDFREAANIQIRIFPQQGGRGSAATVTEANISTNGGGEGGENILGGIQGRLAQVRPLISTLHPLLLSLWLDNAPAVFASSTSIHANHTLAITHLVLKIWGILWRAALARPKKMNADSELEASMEREEQIWLEEYLQSLLRHVSIYFPFGKDTLAMMNPKVTATLQEMNTIYCELTSLFLLAPGVGRTRQQQRSSVQKPSYKSEIKKRQVVKTSCQPSNKEVKKRQAVTVADEPFFSSSSDYDSDEDVLVSEGRNGDDTVVVQTEAPKWADQVVQFVLDALGWVHPEAEDKDCLINTNTGKPSRMSSLSTDFKAQDLVSLLPTLWTLLNCLEPRRREWVFEGLMNFFDNAHVQSGSKKILLQFLALVIKRLDSWSVCWNSTKGSSRSVQEISTRTKGVSGKDVPAPYG